MKSRRCYFLATMMVVAFVEKTVPCDAQIPPEFVPPDDDALYGDLIEDPYASRFLAALLHVKDAPGTWPSDEELEEIAWVQNQESKAYPLIVEILKRENDFAYGLPRKSDALAYVLGSDKGGDKSIVLEEMRKQLPAWNKKHYKGSSHDAFVSHALKLFGRFGKAEDAEIIRPFLDPENGLMSSVAKKELSRLEKRIATKGKAPSEGAKGGALVQHLLRKRCFKVARRSNLSPVAKGSRW